jgi:hypothetical protein
LDIRDKELESNELQKMMDYAHEHFVEQILGSFSSPCIIYTDGKVRYFNKAFKKLATDADELANLFDKKDGFIASLDEYDEHNTNKVSISKNDGRKVYKILRNNINVDDILQMSQIYIFIDITLEEYQKVKIKSYTEVLESLVFKAKYHKEETGEKIEKEKLTIDEHQNNILRRSHVHKTTAREYVDELDNDTLSELQELDELDKEFSESVFMLKDDLDVNGIKHMAEHLQKYANEINLLLEFKDLAFAIESLSKLFESIDLSELDDKKLKSILLMLEGIKDDLAMWRKVVFIEQSAIDIHYLDSSLFSACLKIELMLSDDSKEMESEDDDFVLF